LQPEEPRRVGVDAEDHEGFSSETDMVVGNSSLITSVPSLKEWKWNGMSKKKP
jgi:hypothetical protein